MAILDRLKFWKKDDGFSMPTDFSPPPDLPNQGFAPPSEPIPGVTESFGKDALSPPADQQSFDQPGFAQRPQSAAGFQQSAAGFQQPSIQQSQFQQQQSPQFQQSSSGFAPPSSDQQLQLISAKLDTIRAQLETVLQRLDRIERKDEHPYQQRWRTGM